MVATAAAIVGIGAGAASIFGSLSGGGGGSAKVPSELRSGLLEGIESAHIQSFIPAPFRSAFLNPLLTQGRQNIAGRLARPGELRGDVSGAIAPRLATQSEAIARNFTGIRQSTAGQLARGNAPLSLKGSIQAALGVEESRAQVGERRQALTQSDLLARQDEERVFDLLRVLQSFSAQGRQLNVPLDTSSVTQGLARSASQQQGLAAGADILSQVLQNRNTAGSTQPPPEVGFGTTGAA